jgi:hypothetical protein
VTGLLTRAQGRIGEYAALVRRTTPGPLLVRGGVFATALLSLLVAWPRALVFGPGALAILVVATLPAVAPRGRLPGLVILLAVTGWLISTLTYAETPAFLRLVVLAGALYLAHNLAALAAVLPYDAVVAPGILLRWLARAGVVVLLTVVLALFGAVAPGYLTGRSLIASLVGLALMAATVGYLARLVGRR